MKKMIIDEKERYIPDWLAKKNLINLMDRDEEEGDWYIVRETIRETEKAIQVKIITHYSEKYSQDEEDIEMETKKAWIPKSQIFEKNVAWGKEIESDSSGFKQMLKSGQSVEEIIEQSNYSMNLWGEEFLIEKLKKLAKEV